MWRFIFKALLVFSTLNLLAQEVPDILIEEERPAFAIRYLEGNYNALRTVQNILGPTKSSQEIQVELGFHKRYSLAADFGFANTTRGKAYNYESSGSYWRTGIDVNMSSDTESGNFIGLGLRYARASFDDKITYTHSISDRDAFDLEQALIYSNPDLTSEWMELVFKMRVNIWKQFYTGYTMRYQFFNQLHGNEGELKVFDIPGYGKTTRPNSFGFDYYVGWRINF